MPESTDFSVADKTPSLQINKSKADEKAEATLKEKLNKERESMFINRSRLPDIKSCLKTIPSILCPLSGVGLSISIGTAMIVGIAKVIGVGILATVSFTPIGWAIGGCLAVLFFTCLYFCYQDKASVCLFIEAIGKRIFSEGKRT